MNFDKKDAQHILTYALIHDVGHTPYSHELEEIVHLDQRDLAIKLLQTEEFSSALLSSGIDVQELISFFTKDNANPMRQIVSHKVIGADKLAYLLKDGDSTGMGSFGNVHNIMRNLVYKNDKFGIQEEIAHVILTQMQQYQMMYLKTYQGVQSRLNQRLYTLLGQIGLEKGVLPEDWMLKNDLWYDHFNISAEDRGIAELKKLGRDGIVKQAYSCAGSLLLPDATAIEDESIPSKIQISPLWYDRFIKAFPSKERRKLEDAVAKNLGMESLDILIETGGNTNKINLPDVQIFSSNSSKEKFLFKDMYPDIQAALSHETLRATKLVRVYSRYPEIVASRFDEVKSVIDKEINEKLLE